MVSKDSIRLAVKNIARHGDTDVLPFPLENHWFFDDEDQVVELIDKLDKNYEQWNSDYPIWSRQIMASVGHLGFRAVTQIDPIWNAYLLALVVDIASDIEQKRIEVAEGKIFAYRYKPELGSSTLLI
jgi:hypothetical protein